MRYRICKSFHVETGHMLSKHPGRCRFPHGHSRRIDVVLSSESLDDHDMVCDFKTIKLALAAFIDRFDHALAVNTADPSLAQLEGLDDRVIRFENVDPTTEAMAKHIYDFLADEIASGRAYTDDDGNVFRFPPELKVERIRVTETPTSWAEYGRE